MDLVLDVLYTWLILSLVVCALWWVLRSKEPRDDD